MLSTNKPQSATAASPLKRGNMEHHYTKFPLKKGVPQSGGGSFPLTDRVSPQSGRGSLHEIAQEYGDSTIPIDILNSKYILKANTKLTPRANYMSRNMTKAEQILWFNILAKRQLLGYKFTKQKQVFSYILDFYCSALLLAIEVDGESHSTKQEYDQTRTKFLNSLNIKVIRIANDQIYNSLEGVHTFLMAQVRKINPRN